MEDYSLHEVVVFLGSKTQQEILSLLYRSDIFLLPSITTVDGDTETQGLVLVEAQAVGVPVVASETGGVADSLKNGVTGFLVPEKDVQKITSILITLIKDSRLRASLGQKGKEFTRENFDQDILCDKMLMFYKEHLTN